jgi:hypothetical protein
MLLEQVSEILALHEEYVAAVESAVQASPPPSDSEESSLGDSEAPVTPVLVEKEDKRVSDMLLAISARPAVTEPRAKATDARTRS